MGPSVSLLLKLPKWVYYATRVKGHYVKEMGPGLRSQPLREPFRKDSTPPALEPKLLPSQPKGSPNPQPHHLRDPPQTAPRIPIADSIPVPPGSVLCV